MANMQEKYRLKEEVPAEVKSELALYPDIIQHLLYHRGIVTKEAADHFIHPNYERDIHDSFLLKDMEKAVGRILTAIDRGQKTMIYSDYDADGIPGAVVLHDFFKKIGYANFDNYFPHRYEEGYGLNLEAVERFKNDKVELIITIDCGTADLEQVTKAKEYGIDVIITDHHLSQGAKIPPAYAIVNPKQPDCAYPFDYLCGSGVVYKLIQAILQKKDFGIKNGMEKWFLDMVGLATMADMVPLHGENRVFAHYGLHVLRKSPRLGLRKLLEKSKLSQRLVNEDDIGFTIAPRINAASRMGDPIQAFHLLTASDEAVAEELANHLNSINDERKGLAAAITKEVKKQIKKRLQDGSLPKVLVIGNPDWKPPLLGPVASNLAEEFGVPVFLWGRADGEFIKGSCRSDGTISLIDLMTATPEGLFAGFGGHRMSGGFSISHEKIHLLEEALVKAYENLVHEVPPAQAIAVDRKLSLDDVTWETYEAIATLAPFGTGNEKPLFLFEQITIEGVKAFGKQSNHLELELRNSHGQKIPAIGFFMTREQFPRLLARGEKVDLIATMEKSVFRNYPELRLRIMDIV